MNTQVITPKNAVELVLIRKTKDFRFKPYDNAVQKWFFRTAIAAMLLVLVLAGALVFWKIQTLAQLGMISLAVAVFAAVGYQIATVVPEFHKLRNAEREVSNPLLASFNDDMDLINELATQCEDHHLEYAKTSFEGMSRHLRERISFLVGAFEKVGVIPLAITGYLSYMKAQRETLVSIGGIEWIGMGILALYLLALRMSATAQWMEKVTKLYDQALAVRVRRRVQLVSSGTQIQRQDRRY